MRTLSITLVALALAGTAACKDPNANVARATTSAATTPAAAANASATERLAINPAASRVGFTGAKVTGSHEGSFPAFTGTIDLDPARVENSRIAVDIDTTSVTTDTDRLTTHLKSPDFFDVARFPRATFTSTAIAPGGPNGATHTITGNLAPAPAPVCSAPQRTSKAASPRNATISALSATCSARDTKRHGCCSAAST